jgi:hypothetical protein
MHNRINIPTFLYVINILHSIVITTDGCCAVFQWMQVTHECFT